MGPMSNPDTENRTFVDRHYYCQNKKNCKGPGCRIYTGKTQKKATKQRRRR